jgi:hypothetical protein
MPANLSAIYSRKYPYPEGQHKIGEPFPSGFTERKATKKA